MKTGYYQFSPEFGNPAKNLDRISTALSGIEADLVVLPELAFTGYYFQDRQELRSLAEDISDSTTIEALTYLCRDNGFHLATGFAERKDDRLYNSALLIGPQGVLLTYRKLHLFNTEKEYFDPGDIPLNTFEVRGVRIGLMICFDWIFPETARTLALQGADIICHPSNLVLNYCQEAMRTRCLENSVFAVTANRTGTEIRPRGQISFTGQSQITGPRGGIIARSQPEGDDLVIREIDVGTARNKLFTDNNHLFKDRRPDFYTL